MVKLNSNGNHWQASWRDTEGTRQRKGLGAKREVSQGDAERACRDLERELEKRPGRKIQKAPTLAEWIQTYHGLRDVRVSDATAELDRSTTAKLLDLGRNKRLNEITPADADDWQTSLLGDLTKTTVAGHVRRAKQCFARAKLRELIESNPFDGISCSAPKPVHKLEVCEEMLPRILAAAPDAPWRALIGLCSYAGLRLGEARRQAWTDVLWDSNRLVVRPEGSEETTKQRTREVLMVPELVSILLECRELISGELVAPIEDRNPSRRMNQIVERAGYAKYLHPFKQWRRWRATTWASDFPGFVADKWLGHSEEVANTHYRSVPEQFYSMPQICGALHKSKKESQDDEQPQPSGVGAR